MKTLTFRTFFVLTGVAMLTEASAQTGGDFFLTGSGGLSTLRYSVPAASFRYGYGGSLGAGYSFFFHPQWEASLGVEVAWTGARLNLPLLEDAYQATDGDVPPKSFTFQYAMHGYYERQSISLLEIPLTLRYHFGKGKKLTWYAGAGLRAGIPLTASYTAGSDRLEAQGGYDAYSDPNNLLWLKHPQDAGFGTFENVKGSGSYSAKTAWMATVEAGVLLPLRNGWRLSAGPFLDYGFSNIISSAKDEHPVYYAANTPFEPVRYAHRSLLASSDGQGKAYAAKVMPLMAGLRVRLYFGEDGKRGAGETPPPLAAQSIPKIAPPQKHELVVHEPEHEEDELPARRDDAATKVHVQGTVTDKLSGQPVEAQLFVIDNHTHHVVATVESRPDDGSYSFDLLHKSAYSVTASATGYLVSLGKIDLIPDNAPHEDTIRRDIAMLKIVTGASVTLHNIHFDFNQTTPNSVSIPELKQIAQWLKDNPQVTKVEFSGHTDNRGSAEVNRYISELRAKAVCDYLVSTGIAPERLSHAGYGLTRPVADNATSAGRAQNRRVDLTIMSIGEPESESE